MSIATTKVTIFAVCVHFQGHYSSLPNKRASTPIYFEEKFPTPCSYLVLHAYFFRVKLQKKTHFTQFLGAILMKIPTPWPYLKLHVYLDFEN